MREETSHTSAASTCEPILETGRALKRRILAASALIVLLICVVAGLLIDDQRRSALERAATHSANLSAAFEEQVRRVMDSVSGAIDLITHRIEKEGPNFNLSEWASLIPEVARSTIQLTIIGPDGWMRESTLSKTPVDLSDREHFRVQRDNPNLGLFIGKPVLGRVSKQVTIQVTRRIQAPGGGFGGVLVFSLNPDFLTALHRQVDLGKTGHVTVAGLDSIIRARFTSSDASETLGVGSSLSGSALMREAQKGGDKGSYVTQSVVDGTVRIYNWRKVNGYPLLVTVGLGRDEVLSIANRHAFMILAIGGGAILLVGVLALMLSREISRRVAHEVALSHEGENLRAAHEELKTQHIALIAKSALLAEERINLQKANTELNLARERSETANRAKSAFLANMSHELRTPLNAIIGFSEIMREKIFGDLSDRYAEYAGSIHQSGTALLGLIDQVLQFAKLEAGRVELSDKVQPLSSIVEPALKSVKAQAENRQIELSESLPADISVRGDQERLTQVLMNLLSNAVKFTPAGGGVVLDAHLEDDGGLCLTVADDGIGMSGSEIECALEHFRQIDNSLTKRFEGIGLGLPLARQLADLHGGSLSIESMPGLGTKVRFRLPASRVAVVAEAPQRREKPWREAEPLRDAA
jgi:two-component system, cell cycle sensor histidine kinase PleC